MNNYEVKTGVVMLGRPHFDMPLAQEMYQQAIANLKEQGLCVSVAATPVTVIEEIDVALSEIKNDGITALVVFQGTFTDASMILALRNKTDLPMLIWAVKEKPTGERLRLNSFCGLNLAANALVMAGKPFKPVYEPADSLKAGREIAAFVRAAAALAWLKGKRVLVVGNRPHGYYASNYHEVKLLGSLGVAVEYLSLQKLYDSAQQLEAAEAMPAAASLAGIRERKQEEVENSLSAYLALKALIREKRYDAVAVECWPSFMMEYGGCACYSLSRLNDEGTVGACEADVNGAVTMLLGRFFSGQAVFLADLIAADEDDNTLLFWHCGSAPRTLAAQGAEQLAGVHPNRKVALAVNFPLQAGQVTVARLSPGASGDLRMLLCRGTGVETPLLFQGNTLPVKMEQPVANVVDLLLKKGLEHHYIVVYGDYTAEFREFAELAGMEVIDA